ncbi:MAG: hypothetical protein ACREC4_04005 [Methylocella sp.]
MYFRGGFTFSETTTTVSIFLPITSVYTSAIIKDIIANKEIDQRTQKKYSLSFVLVSCLITLMFIFYLIMIVVIKAYNLGIADFDQFKVLLVLGETIFAAYVGQIVHAMFSAGSTEAAEPSGATERGVAEQ